MRAAGRLAAPLLRDVPAAACVGTEAQASSLASGTTRMAEQASPSSATASIGLLFSLR